jgi:hypothetical protein
VDASQRRAGLERRRDRHSNEPGSTATFTFTGTSVSWIGCEKGSAGGTADVYIDDVLQTRVLLNQSYPTRDTR